MKKIVIALLFSLISIMPAEQTSSYTSFATKALRVEFVKYVIIGSIAGGIVKGATGATTQSIIKGITYGCVGAALAIVKAYAEDCPYIITAGSLGCITGSCIGSAIGGLSGGFSKGFDGACKGAFLGACAYAVKKGCSFY